MLQAYNPKGRDEHYKPKTACETEKPHNVSATIIT